MKRARLQLLRAQIEPHFLFNTLANVRSLARIDRLAAIAMLDHLMRYFSEALPKLRQEESALSDELLLIDAYLRIHQIRMGSRLTYELQVPEQLAVERIPTMLLLTLVENAVKHGINPALDGGSIRVSASRESGNLVLKVTDSGKGLSATAGHGTGLANIRRRLSMLYGDEAVLSLTPAAIRGVVGDGVHPAGRGMIAFLRSALRPLRWRYFFAMQVLGQFAILIESTEDALFGTWLGHPSLHYASMALNVALLVPLGLFADEVVTRGARPICVHRSRARHLPGGAFLSASAMQWVYLQHFPLAPGKPNLFWASRVRNQHSPVHLRGFRNAGLFQSAHGRPDPREFRATELRRVHLEQQLLDSRVAATEAQIDPRRLFDDLARIRSEFAADSPGAEDN